jgi:primase-polymerase (primpol)-like protein
VQGAKRPELGIGFIFVEGDGYCGIDFDRCRDKETGAFRASVVPWIENLTTYCELSPSKTGFHAIARHT